MKCLILIKLMLLSQQGVSYYHYLSHLSTHFLDFLNYSILFYIDISIVNNIIIVIIAIIMIASIVRTLAIKIFYLKTQGKG